MTGPQIARFTPAQWSTAICFERRLVRNDRRTLFRLGAHLSVDQKVLALRNWN